MSVNDSDSWIAAEMEFISRAMEAGIPVLGVCLGSQLMARALGARVYPGRGPELGMVPIAVTPAGRQDPVFRCMPDPFEVFEWHGEVFDLPPGAVALASSDLCPIQAFRFGEAAYGLLFHAEIEPSGIEALCRECGTDLQRAGVEAEHLIRRAVPHVPRLHAWAEKLIAHLVAG
jgi:GMP synthase-like glutamine amidotransferase